MKQIPESEVLPTKQVIGVQHIRVGNAVVTAILDGYIEVQPEYWVNFKPEQSKDELEKAFLKPEDNIKMAINAYLINTGDRLIAIVSGADFYFGHTGGNYANILKAVGINLEAVDTVLLTHMHPDHIGGLIAQDKKAFPNAKIIANAIEHNYWTSESNKAASPEFAKTWFDAVNKMTHIYGEQLEFFDGEKEILAGFQSVSLHGHTPGQTGFIFTSEGEQLFFWADIIGNPAIQLNNIERALIFDVNQKDGALARKKGIEMAASERLLIAGSHLSFPSFGHIENSTVGYRYVSADWQYEL